VNEVVEAMKDERASSRWIEAFILAVVCYNLQDSFEWFIRGSEVIK